MNIKNRKMHWENVFQTKDTTQVSWHQAVPTTSLRLIEELQLPKTAKIIEAGSGDSFMADFLLERGYDHLTLVDISEKALEVLKNRLAERADKLEFVAADITQFTRANEYDLWHDRAVFHFLTEKADIEKYIKNVSTSLKKGAYLIISTFSDNGPDACSGLNVKQYSTTQLCHLFSPNFEKVECFNENHTTPSGGIQNFSFCVFKRK